MSTLIAANGTFLNQVTVGANTVLNSTGLTFADNIIQKSAACGVDVASYLGLCVNPFMEISQENGASSVSITNSGRYAVDQCASYLGLNAGTATANTQQISDPFSGNAGFRRFRNAIRITVGTAQAILGSADNFQVLQQGIEGNFWKGLGWGTADAASVDIVAIVSASVTGTYSLSLRNGSNRSYCTPFSLVANTPTVVFVTIPGDTAGTWPTDNTAALYLNLVIGCGATFQSPANNSWQAGNYIAINGGGTNLAATASATFTVAYMNIFPTGVLPYTSAAQVDLNHLANMRRPYDDELSRCQRYYYTESTSSYGLQRVHNFGAASSSVFSGYSFPVPMRNSPSLNIIWYINDVLQGTAIANLISSNRMWGSDQATPGGAYLDIRTITANARM